MSLISFLAVQENFVKGFAEAVCEDNSDISNQVIFFVFRYFYYWFTIICNNIMLTYVGVDINIILDSQLHHWMKIVILLR